MRTFSAYYQYFREAFASFNTQKLPTSPEEALLLWLQVHPFRDLGSLSAKELKNSIAALWDDLMVLAQPGSAVVNTQPEEKAGLLSWIAAPTHVHVAFVHPLDPVSSTWIKNHDEGRQYLETALADRVVVRSYFHADTPAKADELLEQADRHV